MKRIVAIVLGGSERVWEDAERARLFCEDNDCDPEFYATNDMIAQWHELIVAVTLHPDKLETWLVQRRNAKLSTPAFVYSHDGGDSRQRPNSRITHRLKDWGGSVGMFAYVVARSRGHDRVILCGVPMTGESHFVRKSPWIAVSAFARAWENRKDEMTPYTRSLSGGVTGAMFGEPTTEWLTATTQGKDKCSATG